MAYFLGVDTGGTYTDAVIVDDATDRVIGTAKSLTTRVDLALGIGRAVDAALLNAGVAAGDVALVTRHPIPNRIHIDAVVYVFPKRMWL